MKRFSHRVYAGFMLFWAGVAALGIWGVLLFAAIPENQSAVMFAWKGAVHALLEESSPARWTFWTLLLIGSLGLAVAGFYFSSRLAASRIGVRVALVATGLMCLATLGTKLWFPFSLFLAAGVYFGFRHLRSVEHKFAS